jgi:hypothetical protein
MFSDPGVASVPIPSLNTQIPIVYLFNSGSDLPIMVNMTVAIVESIEWSFGLLSFNLEVTAKEGEFVLISNLVN